MIDTHHHFVPPVYRQFLDGQGFFGGQTTPDWSPEASLATMDSLDVDVAILSVARPGFFFGDIEQARAIARKVNEYAAELVRDRPDRFGFFASLPMPSVDASVEEIATAYEDFACDGVVMLTSSEGVYLGDPTLDPIMAELNERDAVVFVHPNAPTLEPLPGVPVFAVDFLIDTTRAALNIVRHGVLRRFPQIRFILAHGGGFLPYASHRIAALTPCTDDGPQNREEFLADCQKFFFDTALTASPHSLPSLLALARPNHVTFGTDWPYSVGRNSWYFTELLNDAKDGMSWQHSVEREAAQSLIPRLRTA